MVCTKWRLRRTRPHACHTLMTMPSASSPSHPACQPGGREGFGPGPRQGAPQREGGNQFSADVFNDKNGRNGGPWVDLAPPSTSTRPAATQAAPAPPTTATFMLRGRAHQVPMNRARRFRPVSTQGKHTKKTRGILGTPEQNSYQKHRTGGLSAHDVG